MSRFLADVAIYQNSTRKLLRPKSNVVVLNDLNVIDRHLRSITKEDRRNKKMSFPGSVWFNIEIE